jgi:hypothetical protein
MSDIDSLVEAFNLNLEDEYELLIDLCKNGKEYIISEIDNRYRRYLKGIDFKDHEKYIEELIYDYYKKLNSIEKIRLAKRIDNIFLAYIEDM